MKIRVDFLPFEFKPAENAVYNLMSRLQQEQRHAEEKANDYPPGSATRSHYEMIVNLKHQDIQSLKLAASAFYHARTIEPQEVKTNA